MGWVDGLKGDENTGDLFEITALSGNNGNVRIFLKRRTYVTSILGMVSITSFTPTLGFNPVVKGMYAYLIAYSNIKTVISRCMSIKTKNEAES